MTKLWTLGGLSVRQLIAQTWTESWRDSVFGQAGRMAFYHFLAIFPALLMLLEFSRKVPFGPGMVHATARLVQDFLPGQSAALIQQMMNEFNSQVPIGLHWISAFAGALWAAMNGTWALVYGLNRAYEVKEQRNWKELAATLAGLTLALAFVSAIALLCLLAAARVSGHRFHAPEEWPLALKAVECLVLAALLMFSFALIYRFAPNLRNHEWKWSTPGSVCALILWGAATAGLHIYFDHINDYIRTYGQLNRVVMLMLWLYFTNAAILIGGEMNSEIEKAADKQQPADRSGY
jgi:membrane protein